MEIQSIPEAFQTKLRVSILSALLLGEQSFKELKDMAIERLTMSLEQHQKMYEEL